MFNTGPKDGLIKGPKQKAKKLMEQAENIMKSSGWSAVFHATASNVAKIVPKIRLSGEQWRQKISRVKQDMFDSKYKNAPSTLKKRATREPVVGNDVTLLDSFYFTKYFRAKNNKAQKVVAAVSTDFKLNKEQDRAFRLVANHAVAENPPPLRMYLGGVGGTGKRRSLKL